MFHHWVDFPIIRCPKCNKEFQIDDYYDYKSGDSFYCQHCEIEIYIHAIDTTISAEISLDPVKDKEQSNG